MANRYLRQSTASQTRTIGPFVDSTDFATLENALTINASDILLKKNGGASAAKNSGGATADGSGGMYHLTFDATDTATVGELFYSVKVAGALVVFGTFTVLEEAVYDALFASSAPGYVANAPVNVAQFGGTNGTFSGGRPEVNASHWGGTAVGSATVNANMTQISGDSTAADNLEAAADGTGYNLGSGQVVAASVTGAVASVTGNVGGNVTGSVGSVTAAVTVGTNNDKTGYSLSASAIQAIWDALTSALTTVGSIGKLLVDNINATISSRLASASYTAPLDAAGVRSAVGLASANLDTQLGTIDTNVDSILEDTGTTLPDLFPANFAALGINASGHISRVTLVDTTTANTDMRGTDGAYTGTPPTAVAIRQEIDSNSTQLAAIVEDTNALQTDWADGGRLDLLLDQLIAYFTTSRSEPAQGAPAASASPLVKLDWLYKFMRNKSDQSETEQRIYADDGTTVDHKRSVSVSGGVLTLGEVTSGP